MNWNWKKTVAIVIAALVILGAFALIKVMPFKVMPFWATIASLVSFAAGFVSAWLFKDKIEEVVEIPDADEIIERIKEWFSSLDTAIVSKAVSAAKKAKTKETK